MASTDELYTQTIQAQRDYLVKLQEAFNKRCDGIAAATNEKLKTVPEADVEGRKKIFDEQKQQLDQALNELKNEVNHSGGDVRRKLEEIYTQREVNVINNLENDMKTL
jgi:small-conductance mechanosensitive channel